MNTVDIDSLKDAIRDHAREGEPNEVCGLVIKKGQHQEAVRCRNISRNPRHNFLMSPEDYRGAEDRGEVLMCYHSHVFEPPVPTAADKTMSERNCLPFLILSWPADTWELYTPCGWRAELVGRPFVYGILDCYTLMQDYYREKLGIELPDFDREEEWWKKGQNLYLDNFPRHGFVRVDGLREHDVILMQMDSPVPNHCAIYLKDGMILHHPPGHLSGYHPYVADRGYYALSSYCVLRHTNLMK